MGSVHGVIGLEQLQIIQRGDKTGSKSWRYPFGNKGNMLCKETGQLTQNKSPVLYQEPRVIPNNA
jgi:hypothetical protein